MNVMLLTAGLGTRLSPYTSQLPKPAIPFMTVPMAAYPLSLLDKIKINHLVYNTHHLPQKMNDLFKKINWPAKKTISSHESNILGSGGAISYAKKNLIGNGDFIVMNGDEVILPKDWGVIKELLSAHRWNQGIATLLTMQHPDVGTRFGGAWCKDNEVIEFSKSPVRGLSGKHFLGVMVLSEKIFSYFKPQIQEENILYDTLTLAIKEKEKVFTFDCDCQWFETGNVNDFVAASKACHQALTTSPRPPWAEYLMQVIRLNSSHETIIEKDYPDLEAKVSQLHKLY